MYYTELWPTTKLSGCKFAAIAIISQHVTEVPITFTPRACIWDKAIGSVIIVVVDTEIAKSWDLGYWASCKRNESIEFGENGPQYA